jgi:tetratricopeptide (TPR) repeat protein
MSASKYWGAFAFLVLIWLWGSQGVWAQGDTRFEQFTPQEEAMWLGRLRSNPTDARSYYYLGRVYQFQNRDREAAEAFRQATVFAPGWYAPFVQLGKTYRRLGRYEEAAVALRRAVLLKPGYSQAHHFLGLVCLRLGLWEEAAQAFLKAYQHNPGWAETYYDRTNFGIHEELGDKETVLKLVQLIYPENQHLAHLLYRRWSRGNAGQQEFYREVAGPDKKGESGYQEAPEYGYQEAPEAGYLKGPESGFLRGQDGHHRR